MNDILYIKHPKTDERAEVSKDSYITAKWLDLMEFGYGSLTREEVERELDNLLAGKDVTVIGEFMKGDIWKDAPAPAGEEMTPKGGETQ